MLWLKSQSAEAWLDRRTNYSQSLSVMSMAGYILGLGDRHMRYVKNSGVGPILLLHGWRWGMAQRSRHVSEIFWSHLTESGVVRNGVVSAPNEH